MNPEKSQSRPWGKYQVLFETQSTKVKELTVDARQKLSYQSHKHRSEVWVVVEGTATITKDGLISRHGVGEHIYIPRGTKHRLENEYNETLKVIEVQTGTYFGEDDIIRYIDDYGRDINNGYLPEAEFKILQYDWTKRKSK